MNIKLLQYKINTLKTETRGKEKARDGERERERERERVRKKEDNKSQFRLSRLKFL